MKKGYLKPSLISIDMDFEGVIASSFNGSGGEPEEGGSDGSSGGGGITSPQCVPKFRDIFCDDGAQDQF